MFVCLIVLYHACAVGVSEKTKPTLVTPSTPRSCATVFIQLELFYVWARVYFDWLYRPLISSRKREIAFLILC